MEEKPTSKPVAKSNTYSPLDKERLVKEQLQDQPSGAPEVLGEEQSTKDTLTKGSPSLWSEEEKKIVTARHPDGSLGSVYVSTGRSDDDIVVDPDLDLAALDEEREKEQELDHVEAAQRIKDAFSSNTPADDDSKEEVAGATPPPPPVVMKSSIIEKIRNGLYAWWNNKPARYITIILILGLIAVVVFVPKVRTVVLNSVGVRTSVSVAAIDGSTQQPLKNAVLAVDGVTARTNAEGKAKLQGVKLGKKTVHVRKPGFAEIKKQLNLGMRVIDLGQVELKATGIQYQFSATDFLSGKPVKGAMLTSGEATTQSDKDGAALLTIPPNDDETFKVTIDKDGYRTETIEINAKAIDATTVKMVPSQKQVFFSKESGRYDLYKQDIDGRDRKVVLPGTGIETAAVDVLVDLSGKRAAVVSSRDNQRNKDGYLLQALTIVDIESGDSETIEHAEEIALVGWKDSTLIYQMTASAASAASTNRQKIMAYDYERSKRLQLGNANYFSGVVQYGDAVYYGVSATDPDAKSGVYKIKIDGSGKKTILPGNVWMIARADYKTIKIQTDSKWYDLKINTDVTVSAGAPSGAYARSYLDQSAGKRSAWVDQRDSRGALMVYDVAEGKDRQIVIERGMTEARRWLSDSVIVYRAVVGNVATEYAVSIDGGDPHEITEVSMGMR